MPQQALTRREAGEPAFDEPAYALIELLFFAYRDFVGDPDRILADLGFGRAHHRVLHFVARHPGLTIAELLDILKITKQSLSRVLKEVMQKGYVVQRTGNADRRQRLLFATASGHELALHLARLQTQRIARALGTGADGSADAASRFLLAMIDPADQDHVERLIHGSEAAGQTGANASIGERVHPLRRPGAGA